MVKILCFANTNHVGLINLKNSISKQLGWELEIIGVEEKWEGWQTRMRCYATTLRKLDPADIVVLADAFDVLCIRSGGDDFIRNFLHCGKDIVIGAETGCSFNCFPPHNYWQKYKVEGDRRYCNGGLIAGYTHALADMWEWCLAKKYDDDQIGIGEYTNTYPEKVHLDVDSVLFLNDHRAETNYSYLPNTSQIVMNNKVLSPFFIHFHGLNIDRSVPFFNIFQTNKMFHTGKNYVEVGKHINGQEHITVFPADKRGVTLGICIERGVCAGILCLFIVCTIVLLGFYIRKKK